MAVRREQVIVDLTDNVTPGLARMAVAAGVADRALKGMGGTSVGTSRDLDRTAESTQRVSESSNRAGPAIDKFSGRLRTLADAAVTLGPALIPLGAATIPVLTASLVGMGAAAGAIGATVLAFQGLGDALKAIDTYQLEPTAANLEKLRLEAEKLGPAGMEFARFLDHLEPTLHDLQNTAREGIFPGLEDGIDALLTRGPQVSRILADLSDGMGDLARDAGESLAGPKWTAFFDYIESDARPTLEAFGHATGNVALGVANMLVAFAPLSRDFTGGLEDATAAFADWSAHLDSNEGFQNFLDYVRESGPQAVEFLGALAKAVGGLLEAAAPFGAVVLPALTSVLKVFAAIAQSDAGPALYAAAAGLIAFNRAASLTASYGPRLTATFAAMSGANLARTAGAVGLLALSMSDLDNRAGMTNTTMGAFAGTVAGGPWGLAIGAAVGQLLDFKSAYDQANEAIASADDALRSTDTNALLTERANLMGQLAKEHPEEGTLSNYFDAVRGSFHEFTGQAAEYRRRIAEIDDALAQGGDVADLFGESIGQTGDELRSAAASAENFAGALARLNGWFDKRDAVRNYKDSIDELKKSIKDGFTREDAGNLDAVGRNILAVAQSIKNPALRGDFLQGARASLNDLAEHSGPKAARAVQELINKFDDKGLTHPEIQITADDRRAKSAIADVKGDLTIMGRSVTNPKIAADGGQATRTINGVRGLLNALDGDTATTYVRTIHTTEIRSGTSTVEPHAAIPGSADGGTVPRSGRGYADRYHYLLADGEEVISNRWGQADRHRALLKKINAGRMAGGGTAGGGSAFDSPGSGHHNHHDDDAMQFFVSGVWSAAKALKVLEAAAEQQKKVVDRLKASYDAAVARRDEISSGIQSGLAANPWADLEASANPWAAGATGASKATPASALAALQASTARAKRLVAAINTLKAKGITGPVLLDIIGSGDVERAEMMASLDVGTLGSFAGAFTENQAALAAAGLAGGNAIEGANIAHFDAAHKAELKELREIKQAINAANKDNQKGHKKNAEEVAAGVNGAAGNGHHRGKHGGRR